MKFSIKIVRYIFIFITTTTCQNLEETYLTNELKESFDPLPKPKICETPECHKIASTLLDDMDKNVDPCDNFYQYACGNFSKNAVILAGHSTNDSFLQISDKIYKQLNYTITNDVTKNDSISIQLLKYFYESCINEDRIEQNSENEFLKILNDLEGWPVLVGQSWNKSRFSWSKISSLFRERGFSHNYFISLSIALDPKNNSRRLVQIDEPKLGLDPDNLSKGLHNLNVKAYYEYMVNVAEIFGANREIAKQELNKSLTFEIELAKIWQNKERKKVWGYKSMTIEDLNNIFPLPFPNYIEKILNLNVTFDNTEEVNIMSPMFLKNIILLLVETDDRILANYAFWRLTQDSVIMLSERIRKVKRDFESFLSDTSIKSPRWHVCIREVFKKMPLATGALYVRKHFNMTKEKPLKLVENVHDAFRLIVERLKWMDDVTKKAGLRKLENMKLLVTYPDELLDDFKLDYYYKDIQINNQSFIELYLSISQINHANLVKIFREPVIKPDWTGVYGAVAVVNAFYERNTNSIIIPAAILQGVFFNSDIPNYMNYAGLGFIVGHEIAHGFDFPESWTYDEYGNKLEKSWWDFMSARKFVRKANCMKDQYSNYVLKENEKKLDSKKTFIEDIADNGGLKAAYYAYDTWVLNNGDEPLLPGFETFSPRQLFWLSNAHAWCSKYRPEKLDDLIFTDPHSINEFRVIGSMSNMEEFARDYNCPAGSNMINPERNCSVWSAHDENRAELARF